MATKNPAIIKKRPAPAETQEMDETMEIQTPPKRITIPRVPKNVNENKRAKVVSVYVEVGANLGTNSFKFGTTAEINDEDAGAVKNRLYFEGLNFLTEKIKELATQDGPFSRK